MNASFRGLKLLPQVLKKSYRNKNPNPLQRIRAFSGRKIAQWRRRTHGFFGAQHGADLHWSHRRLAGFLIGIISEPSAKLGAPRIEMVKNLQKIRASGFYGGRWVELQKVISSEGSFLKKVHETSSFKHVFLCSQCIQRGVSIWSFFAFLVCFCGAF